MDLPDVKVVTVDTETSGLHQDDGARVASVVVGWRNEQGREVRFLPFDQGRIEEKLPLRQLELWSGSENETEKGGREEQNLEWDQWVETLEWLRNREMLVFHNAKFDLHMLRVGTRDWLGTDLLDVKEGGGRKPLIWDTMIAAKELDPLLPVRLDAVSTRMGFEGKTGAGEVHAWLKQRKLDAGRYDLVPIEIMRKYASGDVDQTMQVFEEQVKRASGKGLIDLIARKCDVMEVLCKMEARGIPYDARKSVEIAEKLEARMKELERTRPFGPGLSEARKWFFDKQGGTYLRVTEKGTASLDEETTRGLVREGIPWAKEYAELAILKTSVSMWYRGYAEKVGPDGRLRCSYRQTKVVSNRMSVERVQLQAIPKQNKLVQNLLGDGTSVRSLIRVGGRNGSGSKSEGDRKLWNLDLQQAELRVAAKYARCEKMLQMLEAGEDFHSETTKRVLGVTEDHKDWKLKRDIGKRLTFSSIFQIGGPALKENLAKVADIVVEEQEATRMVMNWRAQYPEFGFAYEKAKRKVEKDGWVKLLPKTKYESRSYYGEWEPTNTGWSRMVQGSLAEALQLWLVAAEKRVGGVMILTVHDSILIETDDEGKVEQIVGIGEKLLTDLFGIEMPVGWEEWAY